MLSCSISILNELLNQLKVKCIKINENETSENVSCLGIELRLSPEKLNYLFNIYY